MNLSSKEKRTLKAATNPLKPEVWVGKSGLTEGILETTLNSFQTKELVKIKILESCDMGKEEAAAELASRLGAEVLQIVGNIILLYRKLPGDGR